MKRILKTLLCMILLCGSFMTVHAEGEGTDTEAFVTRLYNICLEREPDESGLAHWIARLDNHEITAAEAVYGFFGSPEYQNKNYSDTEVVTALYRTMLNREPDESGLAHWVMYLDEGVTFRYIINGFSRSPEFGGLCSTYGITPGSLKPVYYRDQNVNVTMFVGRLYRICLGRKYDPRGLEHWTSVLYTGEMGGAEVALSFFLCEEFRNKNYSDSEFLRFAYQAMFNREPDASGQAHWMSYLNQDARRDAIIKRIAVCPEFSNLCAAYGIPRSKYTSDGYYIQVNRAANCVTVYTMNQYGEPNVPLRAMVCSTGRDWATPLGTYQTYKKQEWNWLYGNVWGQYSTGIVGDYLFHSVPYYTRSKDDLEYDEYNKLGTFASLGCVRMAVEDVKWLYDNCPIGTTVEIYDNTADPGALGKPDPIRIDTGDWRRGWDPTDPDPANPW